MKIAFFKRLGAGSGLGILIGVLMSLPFLHGRGELIQSRLAMVIWKGVNAPAFWLVSEWGKTDLPPQNEAAWVFLPIALVLAQWIIIGGIAGMWWAIKARKQQDRVSNV